MKYVQRNSLIQQFFKDKGETGFKPIDLTENDLSGLLELLYEIDQTELSQWLSQSFSQLLKNPSRNLDSIDFN